MNFWINLWVYIQDLKVNSYCGFINHCYIFQRKNLLKNRKDLLNLNIWAFKKNYYQYHLWLFLFTFRVNTKLADIYRRASSVKKMEPMSQVQILDETNCVWHNTNAFRKGMNPSLINKQTKLWVNSKKNLSYK